MKHYGDITKLSGYELPVVDVIVGGSPCQDLSVAGKRAGLAGERSGLFMEQVRLVKEMRERDVRAGRTAWAVRPRFMVWENVPGAFSSGNPKGADFAAVIEEIIKVAEPGAAVSVCVPDGGWTKSGCYYAEDGSWSIAWRVHDAQFWGVPQRRKRISLVADFGGLAAPEVLFERKGLRWDPPQSGAPGQGTPAGAEESADPTICLQGNGIDRSDDAGCAGRGWRRGGATQLTPPTDQPSVTMAFGISSYDSNSMKSDNPHSGIYKAETARTLDLTGGSPACNQGGVAIVNAVDCRNGVENECTNGTLQAKESGGTSLNYANVVRVTKP